MHVLLGVEQHEGQVQHDGEPVAVDQEEEGQEGVDGGFGNDVGVEAVAKVDGVDVITEKSKTSAYIRSSLKPRSALDRVQEKFHRARTGITHHSRSLYIIVKNTWRNRLTALINTDSRYSHASPDIMGATLTCVTRNSIAGEKKEDE
jgi:hypothetical protein